MLSDTISDLMSFELSTPEEAAVSFNKIWDNFPEVVEDTKEIKRCSNDFGFRRYYITELGYVLMDTPFKNELQKIFNQYGINTFVELGSGTGGFSKFLQSASLSGTGYTLDLFFESSAHHWGLKQTPLYDRCISDGTIQLQDLNHVIHNDTYDMAVSTWVDLSGGNQHIAFFENNGLPNWYLTINEDLGGCNGNEDYFEWLHNNYEEIYTFKDYTSFSAIHDRAILWSKKS